MTGNDLSWLQLLWFILLWLYLNSIDLHYALFDLKWLNLTWFDLISMEFNKFLELRFVDCCLEWGRALALHTGVRMLKLHGGLPALINTKECHSYVIKKPDGSDSIRISRSFQVCSNFFAPQLRTRCLFYRIDIN